MAHASDCICSSCERSKRSWAHRYPEQLRAMRAGKPVPAGGPCACAACNSRSGKPVPCETLTPEQRRMATEMADQCAELLADKSPRDRLVVIAALACQLGVLEALAPELTRAWNALDP